MKIEVAAVVIIFPDDFVSILDPSGGAKMRLKACVLRVFSGLHSKSKT